MLKYTFKFRFPFSYKELIHHGNLINLGHVKVEIIIDYTKLSKGSKYECKILFYLMNLFIQHD